MVSPVGAVAVTATVIELDVAVVDTLDTVTFVPSVKYPGVPGASITA